MGHQDWDNELLERFLRYVKMETTSDPHVEKIPSTECQWDLLRLLESELRELGLSDVTLNENGYLLARLESNLPDPQPPVIGFLAHVDTSSDVSGKDVKPLVIDEYDGRPIQLADGLVLDPEEDEDLRGCIGKRIITTDGTTLLGADDKAGVAEIMTAVHHLTAHPEIPHGTIEIVFTPDEETGKGMDLFPVEKLRSLCCYTLDGGRVGETETECFNAYQVNVEFTGQVIHLGLARGKMVNAVTMASAFVNHLPQAESPEATDGRFGYYCPFEMAGDLDKMTLKIYLRDFELAEIHRRIDALKSLGEAVQRLYPGGKVSVEAEKQYLNMREAFDKEPLIVENLISAVKEAGVQPIMEPIRGGTDGARLSEMGIPTPNIFAGGHNFHSRKEWASFYAMSRATTVILNLVELWHRERA